MPWRRVSMAKAFGPFLGDRVICKECGGKVDIGNGICRQCGVRQNSVLKTCLIVLAVVVGVGILLLLLAFGSCMLLLSGINRGMH